MNYMFYESSRIVEKQEKHEKLRAYDLILSLERKTENSVNLLKALDLLGKNAKNEYEASIILKAKEMLKARKEKNEASSNISTSDPISVLHATAQQSN